MKVRIRMRTKILITAGCLLAAGSVPVYAGMDLETENPVAGMAVAFNNFYAGSLEPEKEIAKVIPTEEALAVSSKSLVELPVVAAPQSSAYENVAISRVSGYVNVRSQANTASGIVGKLYNNCAATILATVDGENGQWYQIQSGSVNGYIKAQYFITGSEAEKIAREVGTTYATVTSTSALRLRDTPSLTGGTLTMLSQGARYVVIEEQQDFYKLAIDSDLTGYVFKDYVKTEVEFKQAVSLAEEQEKQAEAARRKQEADEAIQKLEEVKLVQAKEDSTADQPKDAEATMPVKPTAAPASGTGAEFETIASSPLDVPSRSDSSGDQAPPAGEETWAQGNHTITPIETSKASSADPKPTSGSSQASTISPVSSGGNSNAIASATRAAVIAYAKQFIGNPYVYGGTSLTTGADCSGFTMSVFAHFGISTGRSSRDQAARGKEVEVSQIQPGDLLFYASGNYINHVALYIGNNQVVHASNENTGITTAPADYRTPCKAVSFFN